MLSMARGFTFFLLMTQWRDSQGRQQTATKSTYKNIVSCSVIISNVVNISVPQTII